MKAKNEIFSISTSAIGIAINFHFVRISYRSFPFLRRVAPPVELETFLKYSDCISVPKKKVVFVPRTSLTCDTQHFREIICFDVLLILFSFLLCFDRKRKAISSRNNNYNVDIVSIFRISMNIKESFSVDFNWVYLFY